MDKKNFHKGHRERVKERFLRGGLDNFEDHQVLELLLFYCYPRRDTNEIAHKMLDEFGTLCTLMEADPLEIAQRCKVTKNVAVLVALTPFLAQRYFIGKWGKKEVIDSSKKAGLYATALFTGVTIECFYLICLNARQQLIYPAKISKGTLGEAPAYPRAVIGEALKHQASSVILAHNHPSGAATPSRSDIESTKRLIAALETIDVDVMDHIIVAGDQYFSFSERKTLPLWY